MALISVVAAMRIARGRPIDHMPGTLLSTVSPLMRLSGHSPSHEAKRALLSSYYLA